MKAVLFAVAIAVVLGLGGWFYVAQVASTNIADILTEPRAYEGQMVTVAGEVSGRENLIFVKYFVVKDGTGSIPVVTEREAGSRHYGANSLFSLVPGAGIEPARG